MQPATPPSPVKPRSNAGAFRSEAYFIIGGTLLLASLCVIPIWSACSLFTDENYLFWVGDTVPLTVICCCLLLIFVYLVTIFAFFKLARESARTDQTIMLISNVFILLLGLLLILMSLQLSRQSLETYNNLMNRCEYSQQTHTMYEYSYTLQNIRRQPACMAKLSVEECHGYQDAFPYTTFLKAFELDYRCNGFCSKPVPITGAGVTALVSESRRNGRKKEATGALSLHHHHEVQAPAATLQPLPLFSQTKSEYSCEGFAARDIKNYAGDLSWQYYYMGTALCLAVVVSGFVRIFDHLARKDDGTEYGSRPVTQVPPSGTIPTSNSHLAALAARSSGDGAPFHSARTTEGVLNAQSSGTFRPVQ